MKWWDWVWDGLNQKGRSIHRKARDIMSPRVNKTYVSILPEHCLSKSSAKILSDTPSTFLFRRSEVVKGVFVESKHRPQRSVPWNWLGGWTRCEGNQIKKTFPLWTTKEILRFETRRKILAKICTPSLARSLTWTNALPQLPWGVINRRPMPYIRLLRSIFIFSADHGMQLCRHVTAIKSHPPKSCESFLLTSLHRTTVLRDDHLTR